MELFLNLLWLSLVVGAFVSVLRARRHVSQTQRLLPALGALLCVAALLFPPISITDDLHFDAFAIEDSSATKRVANAVAQHAPLAAIEWFALASLAFLLVPRQPKWRVIAIRSTPYQAPLLSPLVCERAPPALFPA